MPTRSPQSVKTGANRLLYGYVNGSRRGPRRTAMTIRLAGLLDRGLAATGCSKPVLLVSGFWRSGTTWLQESLATALRAKTIFEPLAPMEPAIRRVLAERFGECSEDLTQATIPGDLTFDDPLWRYLDRACFGHVATPYLLSCREELSDSLRPAIILKDVRLQANLAAFHHRYAVPVVHVRRHPCAAVASLIAAAWHWSFERVSLAVLLPRLGRALDPSWLAAALHYDTDVVSRIAVLWAVTEHMAEASIAGRSWGALLSYERFAAEPDISLSAVCDRLGLIRTAPVDFAQPSASVHPEAFAAYAAPPAERWRTMLSEAERTRILSIVDRLHPEWRIAGIVA